MTRLSKKGPLLVTFLGTSLAGCGVTSLFDSDDSDNGNGASGDAPSYLGAYAGTMDASDPQTDEAWPDRAADLEITFDDSARTVDLAIAISGLPGGTKEIELNGCSPGPTTVFCSNVRGSTLYDIEFSFTSSSVSGHILESERRPNGNFAAIFEAEGTLTER